MDGVFKLFNAVERARKRLGLVRAMKSIVKVAKKKYKAKISTIELCEKENQNP